MIEQLQLDGYVAGGSPLKVDIVKNDKTMESYTYHFIEV
jgi:hypothetical protein